MANFFAHTIPNKPTEYWEPLEDHLEKVGKLAAEYCSRFSAEDWGEAAGYWHDLGKYSLEFQEYLKVSQDEDAGEESPKTPKRVDHSTAGAQHAATVLGGHVGQLVAYMIAGHHAGLPDGSSGSASNHKSTLEYRLDAGPPRVPSVELPPSIRTIEVGNLPFPPSERDRGFQVAFFARMVFSALIDADRTATQAFCDPAASRRRVNKSPAIARLRDEVDRFLDEFSGLVPDTDVNRMRARVLADCREASSGDPGVYSLSVPTGGGKTLSSLAFALNHASEHQMDRVIFGIPFTTIIEQTCDTFRQALGSLAHKGLLEHHSQVEPERMTRVAQFAVENWDVPIVVTTNVQLFESLFSSRTTPCRKLHRIAKSVIVLDEAQAIPVDVLRPTLRALQELVDHYGCTVVLCTATQPALTMRPDFQIGIEMVREIVSDPKSLFDGSRRVEFHRAGLLSEEGLANRLCGEDQVLCIVNTRVQAASIYKELSRLSQAHECFHLSTLMCGSHRREVLKQIRSRISEGVPIRVVSTQLVEAGVDIDFPVVYRAPAGFDSLAQAAGRCNREGLIDMGRVVLFSLPTPPPPGLLRQSAEKGQELIDDFPDPTSQDAIEKYFKLFYWSQSHRWDQKCVMESLEPDLRERKLRIQFREADCRYQFLSDSRELVLVPYGAEGSELVNRFLNGVPLDQEVFRAIQPFLVGVHPNTLKTLLDDRNALPHDSGVNVLISPQAYSAEYGLTTVGSGFKSESLIV